MFSASLTKFSDSLSPFASIVDSLCQPNPKYTPNPAEQEINCKRNKVVLYLHIAIVFVFFFDYLINNAPPLDCIYRSLVSLTVVGFLLLSCRLHPEIFRTAHGIACMVFGPGAISGAQSAYVGLAVAPILPTCHFVFTGSIWHALVQAVIQLIFLNTLYQDRVRESLEILRPDEAAPALTGALSVSFVIYGLTFSMAHYFLTQAYDKITTIEKKKTEIENQKTFLLSFSHELRNLINSLVGNVKLASLEKSLPSGAKELLLTAEVCGELLLHLVNNILDTGKVEIGELEINPSPNKVHETLQKIWGICSELIKQKGLYGRMKISKSIPRTLLLDHYRLTQIFLNLIGNAIKYTEKGSININVEWMGNNPEVTEDCFKPYPFNQDDDDQDEGIFEKNQGFDIFKSDYLILNTRKKQIDTGFLAPSYADCEKGVLKVTIIDTGYGMTKEQLVQLFQKFTQVSTDPSRRMLGTGLGLFISKQICQGMGGEIRVFSKKDVGSCFTFCLPITTVQSLDEHSVSFESLKTAISVKRLKAMIVDDAPFNHLILTNFFEKLGIEVVDVAVNGLEAYKKFLRRCQMGDRPDIVAMDIEMPVMNGKEASQKIRELEIQMGLVPCFLTIVSGNCTSSVIKECLDKHGTMKADSFLKKPVSLEELLRALGFHFIRE